MVDKQDTPALRASGGADAPPRSAGAARSGFLPMRVLCSRCDAGHRMRLSTLPKISTVDSSTNNNPARSALLRSNHG
ncbi:MAG: hypothetical protein OEQ39_28185 [Gammaproteobacteria bacterium]|nr:hypothetical protein [Gammaproteobacteria bacterium]